jgi:hypothetical protein
MFWRRNPGKGYRFIVLSGNMTHLHAGARWRLENVFHPAFSGVDSAVVLIIPAVASTKRALATMRHLS